MPIPSDEAFWNPIARKLLSKNEKQQLPHKKVIKRLCRRGARRFGLDQSDTDLQLAVQTFVEAAKTSGSLTASGRFLALPAEVTSNKSQPNFVVSRGGRSREDGKGKEVVGVPARSSASPETEAQPVKQSKKRKSEAAADSSTAPLSCAAPEEPQAHKPSKGPARKKARRDATTETEPHPSGQEETGQAAQLSNEPLKAPRSRKKKQKPAEASPLSTEDDAAGVNNADSMPGIPGSGNEMTWKQLDKRTDVKRGRFSQAEKELILAATKDYARAQSLSETDLTWIYKTRNNTKSDLTAEERAQRKGAWSAISQAMPHRTPKSVWAFATRVLHEGNYLGNWSKEDCKRLMQLHAERGNKWREIGAALGRLPETCRDKHRELEMGDSHKKGTWSAVEEGKLSELVTQYIEERPEPDPNSGRILIDAVNWEIISRQHGTRNPKACRQKWYDSLAPSMVSRGDWGIGDDRRLLKALFRGGFSTEWQVDWGALVPQRTAVAARRRWRLMLKSVPDHLEKSLCDIIDELVSTHIPFLKDKAGRVSNDL